ncbi:MAG TPA: type II toxin-antitoxin system prevent-host-death family antitoxin [Terriglobia bacterium]|nr:type II toxin-antitoxin system prevent-host-death family antitoxin [Terriglobia bacterium]
MTVYSYSEARQQLAELLDRARREGQVEIRRRDGQSFVVRPTESGGSPLDVPGVETSLSRGEVVALVRESRRSTERFLNGKAGPSYRLLSTAKRRGRLNRSR